MSMSQLGAAGARFMAYVRNEPCRGQGWWPMVKGDVHGPRVNVCPRCGLEEIHCTRPEGMEAPDR